MRNRLAIHLAPQVTPDRALQRVQCHSILIPKVSDNFLNCSLPLVIPGQKSHWEEETRAVTTIIGHQSSPSPFYKGHRSEVKCRARATGALGPGSLKPLTTLVLPYPPSSSVQPPIWKAFKFRCSNKHLFFFHISWKQYYLFKFGLLGKIGFQRNLFPFAICNGYLERRNPH